MFEAATLYRFDCVIKRGRTQQYRRRHLDCLKLNYVVILSVFFFLIGHPVLLDLSVDTFVRKYTE